MDSRNFMLKCHSDNTRPVRSSLLFLLFVVLAVLILHRFYAIDGRLVLGGFDDRYPGS